MTLEERISALEAELWEQWAVNHAEHCANELPCPNEGKLGLDGCHWKMPELLRGYVPLNERAKDAD